MPYTAPHAMTSNIKPMKTRPVFESLPKDTSLFVLHYNITTQIDVMLVLLFALFELPTFMWGNFIEMKVVYLKC